MKTSTPKLAVGLLLLLLAAAAGLRLLMGGVGEPTQAALASSQVEGTRAVPISGEPTRPGVVTVYLSPTCGCCGAWVDHLREEGFEVETTLMDDMGQVKRQYGIAPMLSSCHTAVVDGYLVEGHVPADEIRRLLAERPAVAGIAVPGMPMGSPGMEGPRSDPYEVLTFDQDGRTTVFARY